MARALAGPVRPLSLSSLGAVYRQMDAIELVSLIIRTVQGFLSLIGVLAMVLFLSVGSAAVWQAWIYLSVFSACSTLIAAYLVAYDRKLLAGRVRGGPLAEMQGSQKIIHAFACLIFIGLFIVSGMGHSQGWPLVEPSLTLIADLMVVIGFSNVSLVFRENSYSRATIDVSSGQNIIRTGPYSAVRYPMYGGSFVLLVFTPITLG
jgi:protein-S-isoprenylcysteine O-methyltransferase Ste14